MILPEPPEKLGPTMDQKMQAAERLTGIHTPGIVQALLNNAPNMDPNACAQFQQFIQKSAQVPTKKIRQMIWTLGA